MIVNVSVEKWAGSKGPATTFRAYGTLPLPDGSSVRLYAYGPSKKEARAKWFAKSEDRLERFVPRTKFAIMRELFDELIAEKVAASRSHNTIDSLEQTWRLHIEPYVGSISVDAVGVALTKSMIYRPVLEPGTYPSGKPYPPKYKTAKNVKVLLSMLFKNAMRRYRPQMAKGLVYLYDVTDDIDLPKRQSKPVEVIWSEQELAAFLARSRELYEAELSPYYPFFRLCVAAGLRFGEAIGLTWADIVQEGETWVVDVNKQITGSRTQKQRAPKWGSSGQVPISDDVVEMLMIHKERQRAWGKNVSRFNRAGHVVTTFTGKTPSRQTIRVAFANACKSAGVPYAKIHMLRKLYASLFVKQAMKHIAETGEGLPVEKLLAQNLRHKDSKVSRDIYLQILKGDDLKVKVDI